MQSYPPIISTLPQIALHIKGVISFWSYGNTCTMCVKKKQNKNKTKQKQKQNKQTTTTGKTFC